VTLFLFCEIVYFLISLYDSAATGKNMTFRKFL